MAHVWVYGGHLWCSFSGGFQDVTAAAVLETQSSQLIMMIWTCSLCCWTGAHAFDMSGTADMRPGTVLLLFARLGLQACCACIHTTCSCKACRFRVPTGWCVCRFGVCCILLHVAVGYGGALCVIPSASIGAIVDTSHNKRKKEVGKHGQHVSCSIALLWTGCEPRSQQQLCSQQSAVTMRVCGWCLFQGMWAACLVQHAVLLGRLGLGRCCRASKPGASGCPQGERAAPAEALV
jgi:hypothetical protein